VSEKNKKDFIELQQGNTEEKRSINSSKQTLFALDGFHLVQKQRGQEDTKMSITLTFYLNLWRVSNSTSQSNVDIIFLVSHATGAW
jgi:hypothetical protein